MNILQRRTLVIAARVFCCPLKTTVTNRSKNKIIKKQQHIAKKQQECYIISSGNVIAT
jgi:hypothetical protein